MKTHHDQVVGRNCVVGPRRPRSERSDYRNPEYNPSGTSSLYPVSPLPTVSDINSTLSLEGVSGRRCPFAPPCHRHSNLLVKSPPTCSLQVHIEVSHKYQLCPHWPLHHCRHHIPNRCVVKQCQVTVGPVTLSCVRFYLPAIFVIIVTIVVVAVFVNVIAVIVLSAGMPPHGPLPPCHPSNGENTKAWD